MPVIMDIVDSNHSHAQHNQQFSRLLVSAYNQATIRPTHYLELMKKKHTIVHIDLFTPERDRISFSTRYKTR
jgi:hypothetical protein